MSTNVSSPNLLLRITLCKTDKPTVSRMLSVPSGMSFSELHEAIAATFGWSIEPCTSWVFKMVDQDPLVVTRGDGDALKLKTAFTAFWTAPDQGYNVTPAQHAAHLAVGLRMQEAQVGKYWTYDYNISRQPHAVKVIDTLSDDQNPELTCVGGSGHISRMTWQFADLLNLGDRVKVGGRIWVSDSAALAVKLGKIQEKFEERNKAEADLAATPEATSQKRVADLGVKSAEADKVVVVLDGVVKMKRVTREGKLISEIQVMGDGSNV